MKKILSVFAMMAMLFAACTPEDQPGTNNGGNENEGGNNNGGENTEKPEAAPELKLTSVGELEFTAEGGEGQISYVLKNPVEGVEIAATCEADWVEIVRAGESRTIFNVAPYESTESPRSTKVVVSYDKLSVEVAVTQSPVVEEEPVVPGPEDPNAPDVTAAMTYYTAEYYGNAESEGYCYYVVISDTEVSYNEQGQMLVADGANYYILDLYSSVAVGDGEKILPNGEYTFDASSTGAPGTMSQYYSTYVTVPAGSQNVVQLSYTAGTVTVSDNKIEALITLEDGKVHKVVYEGSLNFGGGGNTGESVSTLTGDVELSHDECLIIAYNWGDYYEVGLDNYTFEVYTNAETGVGDYFIFETLTSADTFVGNYTFLTDATEVLDNLVMPASMDEDYNLLGSWYLSLGWNEEYEGPAIDGVTVAPLFDGEMVFECDEEAGTCTILLDGYDDAGNNVVASLSGMYMLEDNSEEAAYVKKNRASSKSNGLKNIKSLKTPSKSNTFVMAR